MYLEFRGGYGSTNRGRQPYQSRSNTDADALAFGSLRGPSGLAVSLREPSVFYLYLVIRKP
ncbi:UNVERIFIED_ORG: hypothetical protein BCL66_102260 [Martelella mediterranea]